MNRKSTEIGNGKNENGKKCLQNENEQHIIGENEPAFEFETI